VGQDPAKADDYDAVIHLGSDYGGVVLGAEQALRGTADAVNGLETTGDLDGLFEVGERRTGFVGRGLPAKKFEVDAVPEKSPLSMGFKSTFRDSLPDEDKITIAEGPFAQGTTQQVSRLTVDVGEWYADTDHSQRIDRMFAPGIDESEVGEVGDRLGATSGVTETIAEATLEDARGEGIVGHSQKTARARDADFEPIIKRRDFDTTQGDPGLHFNSMQAEIAHFAETRNAMANLRFDERESGSEDDGSGGGGGDAPSKPDIDPEKNGILGYIG
jgi:hypothetical protein